MRELVGPADECSMTMGEVGALFKNIDRIAAR
jgi:hypothetical protein